MQTPEEFLEANGLETRTIDRAGLVAVFQKEMEAGLAGEPSSLKMIPTFTSPYGEVTKDTPVTVLDAGGTNFRRTSLRSTSAFFLFPLTGKPVGIHLVRRFPFASL